MQQIIYQSKRLFNKEKFAVAGFDNIKYKKTF